MTALVLRRLLVAIPTMFFVIAAAFFLMRAAPGGPFDSERQLPPEIEQKVKANYDLDKPVLVQFQIYMGRILTGDFGPSLKYKDKSVADIIAEGLPTSAVIGFASMAIALVFGVALGVAAGLRQNKPQDYVVMTLALIGVCVPPLVMGPLLSLIFGVQLEWLPTSGLSRDQYSFKHLLLPVVTLALPQIAIISRLMRASMIEAMASNAVRTARAKGLPEREVVWSHALPVAILPIVSYLGPAIAGVLTGSFVIESVFQLPDLAGNSSPAALTRDYTLVMGVVILYAALIMALNLIADMLYRVLDPRART
ncbi:MAG: ABC transporter permease subunit [Alphaproteobacteria bacterium]